MFFCLPLLFMFFVVFILFKILSQGHFFIAFWEREEGRETLMWERNIDWLPPEHARTGNCLHLDRGSNPQPRHMPWLELNLQTLCYRTMFQQTEPHWPGHHRYPCAMSFSLLTHISLCWCPSLSTGFKMPHEPRHIQKCLYFSSHLNGSLPGYRIQNSKSFPSSFKK